MIAELERSEQSKDTGSLMLNSLTLTNFRCFERATLEKLKQVNIVVGRNASGKTALLESLYLTLGDPSLAFKLRTWRGFGQAMRFATDRESRAGLWRDLFHNFQQNRAVIIDTTGSTDISRTLRITCDKKEAAYVINSRTKAVEPQIQTLPPITFEYKRGKHSLAVVVPTFSDEGIKMEGSPEPLKAAFFASTVPIDPGETATYFSELSKRSRDSDIVMVLRDIYGMVDGLSLQLNSGSPMVYASVGAEEKIPVGLLSSGINKVLAYLVAIAQNSDGIVIVDEIENGLYYETMPMVWKALHRMAKIHNVQLFISTHSSECLRAATSVVVGNESDFSLIRTELDNGKGKLRMYSGETFEQSIRQHVEVR